MKPKTARIIRIVTLVSAAVCFVSSMLLLLFDLLVPGLGPFSLAITVLGVLCSLAARRKAKTISGLYWVVMATALTAGAALNMAAGISQLLNALR